MKPRKLYSIIFAICLWQVSPINCPLDAQAKASKKEWTTYQRQVNLMKRINSAQKQGLLTNKEAKELRKDLSKIAVKKQKLRDSHDLSKQSEAQDKIEKRLTKTSKKINETKLENQSDAR